MIIQITLVDVIETDVRAPEEVFQHNNAVTMTTHRKAMRAAQPSSLSTLL